MPRHDHPCPVSPPFIGHGETPEGGEGKSDHFGSGGTTRIERARVWGWQFSLNRTAWPQPVQVIPWSRSLLRTINISPHVQGTACAPGGTSGGGFGRAAGAGATEFLGDATRVRLFLLGGDGGRWSRGRIGRAAVDHRPDDLVAVDDGLLGDEDRGLLLRPRLDLDHHVIGALAARTVLDAGQLGVVDGERGPAGARRLDPADRLAGGTRDRPRGGRNGPGWGRRRRRGQGLRALQALAFAPNGVTGHDDRQPRHVVGRVHRHDEVDRHPALAAGDPTVGAAGIDAQVGPAQAGNRHAPGRLAPHASIVIQGSAKLRFNANVTRPRGRPASPARSGARGPHRALPSGRLRVTRPERDRDRPDESGGKWTQVGKKR